MDEVSTLFSCRQCGFCCHGETTVSLDDNDQQRMMAALDLGYVEISEQFWRVRGSVVQMKTTEGHCIFYDKGCRVYHGRPWRCAQWPLVPALLNGEENFLTISESCPGINKELSYEEFCKILSRHLRRAAEQTERDDLAG